MVFEFEFLCMPIDIMILTFDYNDKTILHKWDMCIKHIFLFTTLIKHDSVLTIGLLIITIKFMIVFLYRLMLGLHMKSMGF